MGRAKSYGFAEQLSPCKLCMVYTSELAEEPVGKAHWAGRPVRELEKSAYRTEHTWSLIEIGFLYYGVSSALFEPWTTDNHGWNILVINGRYPELAQPSFDGRWGVHSWLGHPSPHRPPCWVFACRFIRVEFKVRHTYITSLRLSVVCNFCYLG